MKNTILTDKQVGELLFWTETRGKGNWGSWGNYPLPNCTYTSIDDCQVFIKFDNKHEYRNEIFTHLVSSRKYSSDNKLTLSYLKSLYNESGDVTLKNLFDEAERKFDERKQKEIAFAVEYRRQAESGELTDKLTNDVVEYVEQAIEGAMNNDFSTGKIGDTVKSLGHIDLGSGATAVHSGSVCEILKGIEQLVKSNEFDFLIHSKSGTGKTKYATMTDSSRDKLLQLLNKAELIKLLVSDEIASAKNFKCFYED